VSRIRQELEWLQRNTVGIDGERAAARESWANVWRYLSALNVAEMDILRELSTARSAKESTQAALDAMERLVSQLTDQLAKRTP
jgi:hypothetical protein